MGKVDYFDPSTIIERVRAENIRQKTEETVSRDSSPIVRYAQTLGELRKSAAKISGEHAQVEFGRLVRESLGNLAAELGLADDHFVVDTSGDPLLVREGAGQHWILPTHFENGAYFSAPHADHQLSLAGNEIPKIRIGKYTRFGKGSGINAGGDIIIGDGAWLSPGSLLLRQDHGAYGRPSVGSRTVTMTRQPAVVLRDYAWVGRDAMVGWNSDYLGLASIVGTRSFINGWVGDYSIVGDHDRILQYLPFKAFLFSRYDLTVEETIRISDWDKVNQDWLAVYSRDAGKLLHQEDLSELPGCIKDVTGKNARALLVRPDSLSFLPPLAEARTDIVTHSQTLTPFVLQWAADNGNRKVRVRSDLTGSTLPVDTAGTFHYNKRVGYDLVVSAYADASPTVPLEELQRVLLPGGIVLTDRRNLIDALAHPDNLVEIQDVRVGGNTFTAFRKK